MNIYQIIQEDKIIQALVLQLYELNSRATPKYINGEVVLDDNSRTAFKTIVEQIEFRKQQLVGYYER